MQDYLEEDLAFYRRRVAQEEAAIRSAACPSARERHQELADAYHFRCRALTALRLTEPVSVIDSMHEPGALAA